MGSIHRVLVTLIPFVAVCLATPTNYYDRSDFYDILEAIGEQEKNARGNEAWGNENEMVDQHPSPNGEMTLVRNWPEVQPKIGQVGGLATCSGGHLHIFHRADRVWQTSSFDPVTNEFTEKDKAIQKATVLILNKTDGRVMSQWGENKFYMPHGMTIDHEDNVWLTDVALHQVFKFEDGKREPSLVLGKKFEAAKSNDDKERFCKPTDVAVDSKSGDIFVADGYCNSRVMKFDKNGKFLTQFGDGSFDIPHSLALIEDLGLICVADREHKSIRCFDAEKPDQALPKYTYEDDNLGYVYAIEYDVTTGYLYVVTGRTPIDGSDYTIPPMGLTIDMRKDNQYKVDGDSDFIAGWGWNDDDSQIFSAPHDVTVSPKGKNMYVGEIGPDNVWKFSQIVE